MSGQAIQLNDDEDDAGAGDDNDGETTNIGSACEPDMQFDRKTDYSIKKQTGTYHLPQHVYLRKLSGLLRDNNNYVRRAQGLARLEASQKQLAARLCPLLSAITAWAIWCLKDRNVGKGRIKVSSVRRYLSSIAPSLLTFGAELSASELAGSDACARLINVYDKVVDSLKNGPQRMYAIGRLSEFHHFLTLSTGAPAILWRGQTVVGRNRPSANVLTEAEYKVLRQSIHHSAIDMRRKQLMEAILICGYRLGLRRDEICGRQLNCLQGFGWNRDIFNSIRPQLWIHPTALSSVKVDASNRRSPMFQLLEDDELKLLFRWAERRRAECGKDLTGTELLFTNSAISNEKLTDNDGFSDLTHLMAAVTGDPSLEFHSLRHSFITLLGARLLSVQIDQRLSARTDQHSAPPAWSTPTSWQASDHLQGIKLLKHLFLQSHVPRQAMYMVSALAGHIDPRETIDTYSHALDWLLHGYMLTLAPRLDLQAKLLLAGTSDSTIRVRRHRNKRKLTDIERGPKSGEHVLPMNELHTKMLDKGHTNGLFARMPELRPLRNAPLDTSRSASPHLNPPHLENLYRALLSVKEYLTPEQSGQIGRAHV